MEPTPGTAFTLPLPLFALALALSIALAPLIFAVAPFMDLRRAQEGAAP